MTYGVRDNAFFFDTVQLGSVHAHFYFENNFSLFFLPQNMDSGHPPIFGMYIALMWKWFGRSLATSHFAMLPFLFGIIFYLHRLGKYFFGKSIFGFVVIGLILFDPCIAGQAVLVSPDVVLVLGFLMGMDGILNKKGWSLAIGIIALCTISMRGMTIAAALFLFDFLNRFLILKQPITFSFFIKKIKPYVVGGSLGVLFLAAHYVHTGWIGYHADSPWAPAFERVNGLGLVKNIAILGWRLLDFGRVFLWLVMTIIGVGFFIKKQKTDLKTKQLLLVFATVVFFSTPALVLHKGLLGHRYLLPIFVVIDFLAVYLVFIFGKNKTQRTLLFTICFLGLSLGNFWIYPKKIAKGWDSTLAHLPYFELRKEMIHYLELQKIPIEKVGSAFPNLRPMKFIDLNDSLQHFPSKNLKQQEYIFYSNIFNDFTDEEIDELEQKWKVKKELKKGGVCVVLYSKL